MYRFTVQKYSDLCGRGAPSLKRERERERERMSTTAGLGPSWASNRAAASVDGGLPRSTTTRPAGRARGQRPPPSSTRSTRSTHLPTPPTYPLHPPTHALVPLSPPSRATRHPLVHHPLVPVDPVTPRPGSTQPRTNTTERYTKKRVFTPPWELNGDAFQRR